MEKEGNPLVRLAPLEGQCQNSDHCQSQIEGASVRTVHSPGHLGGQQQNIQRLEPCPEERTLVALGLDVLHPLPGAERLAPFFTGLAKPRGSLLSSESLHGRIALFKSSLILLQPAVQIVTAAGEVRPPQRLANGPRIGVV